MPAPPTDEEIRYVASKLAEAYVEQAAHNPLAMAQHAHDWFPDHDAVDWRQIGLRLSDGLGVLRQAMHARLLRLQRDGKARIPGAQAR